MSELISEMEEAIKREKLEKVWKTYGNLILFSILAIILATGGYSFYSSRKMEQEAKQTDMLFEAQALNDPAKLAEAAARLKPGLAAIAKIRAASAFVERQDMASALPLYDAVAKDEAVPKEFRDLGAFMAARLSVKENPDIALQSLTAQTADATNPYRFHAHLEAALILAHQKQDYAEAKKHVDAILLEQKIPPSLNAKANALSIIYGLKEKK